MQGRPKFQSFPYLNNRVWTWGYRKVPKSVIVQKTRTGIRVPGVLAQSEACVLSKHEVLGSKPRYSSCNIRYGVVGNISACHADARGSIPRFGVLLLYIRKQKYFFPNKNKKIRRGRFELPTKGSLRLRTLQSSALPLSYLRTTSHPHNGLPLA